MAEIVHDPAAMREKVIAARTAGRRVGFVPTMGALHAGHASLVDRAAAGCDDVAVSIFVNPTQFGPHEDFTRYPRSFAEDCRLLDAHGARWVFAPEAATIYPPGDATRVIVTGPAEPFEGAIRPGHFAGVATVVLKLFLAVPADAAYFGAKDWQQTRVVMRMVRDLAVPIEIVVCPTVREADGLAMSSRNAYLAPDERRRAVGLSAALDEAARLWTTVAPSGDIERALRETMERHGIVVDYAAIVEAESLATARDGAEAVALVAGRLGATRLIDNRLLPARGRGASPC
jgi:pantoate--beta-alanine ligase